MSKKLSGKALVVQIGETETRVACMTLGAKLPQIQASTVIPTPSGAIEDGTIKDLDAMRSALSAVCSQPEFSRVRKVLFVLASTQVITHVAGVPYMKNRKKLPQILQANADMYFPVDTSDYQVTWQVIGEREVDGEKQIQVQLWATPKSLLGRYYLLARDCGLSVAAIDYVGHSFVNGINASYEIPQIPKAKKPKKAKKSRKFDAVEEIEEGINFPEQETTTLFLNLDKDHILMSFVQENQVLLQRLLQRSTYSDADLNDIFMEIEYFHTEFPACVSGDVVVSGSGVEDDRFLMDLEDLVQVPLQRLHCEPDQIWCIALGASLSTLDFGDPMLASVGGKKKVNLNANIPLQPVLLVLGILALAGALVLNMTAQKTWDMELQGLRDQQMILNVQSAAVNGYADKYNEYAAEYAAYSSDWDNLFASVRTYNDNLGLILEELEDVLPKDSVVTNLSIDEQSITMNTAFQEKEDVVYFLLALRQLQYADLTSISDLQVLTQPQTEMDAGTSGVGDPTGLGNTSALGAMLGQLGLGGGAGLFGNNEAAPSEGSLEAAPTEGGKTAAELMQDAQNGTLNPMELMTPEFLEAVQADDVKNGRQEPNRLQDFLVQMVVGYSSGNMKPEDLSDTDKAKMMQLLMIYESVNGPITGPDVPSDSTGNGGGSGSSSGNSGSSGSSGSISIGTSTGNTTGDLLDVPKGEEREKKLKEYGMTVQELKDGLDNLETVAEYAVLDKNYSKTYTKNTMRSLRDDATLKERKEAIRYLLKNDALAMHQFFLIVQEDMARPNSSKILTNKVEPDYWVDLDNRQMFFNSDQALLDKKLPGLIDMLTKNEAAVEATENLIKTYNMLNRKLACSLTVEMGVEKEYTCGMNFELLQDDILSTRTKKDAQLNTVVRKMLSPEAQKHYDNLKPAAGTSTGSNALDSLLEQLLGGNTGGTTMMPEEPAGNFGISVVLTYKEALIQNEQVRKGLDITAKIADPVEVAG